MQQNITVFGSLLSAVAVLVSGLLFWGASSRIPLSFLTWSGDSPPEKRFRQKRLTYALAAWFAVAVAVVSSSTVVLDRYYGPLFDPAELAWMFGGTATELVGAPPAQSAPSGIDPGAAAAESSAVCLSRVAVDWPPRNFCRPDRSMRQCRFRLDPAIESDEPPISRDTDPDRPASARLLVGRLASDRHLSPRLVLSAEAVCTGAS